MGKKRQARARKVMVGAGLLAVMLPTSLVAGGAHAAVDPDRSDAFTLSQEVPTTAKAELDRSSDWWYAENLEAFDLVFNYDSFGTKYSLEYADLSLYIESETVPVGTPVRFSLADLHGQNPVPVGVNIYDFSAYNQRGRMDSGWMLVANYPAVVPAQHIAFEGCEVPESDGVFNPQSNDMAFAPDLSGDLDLPDLWAAELHGTPNAPEGTEGIYDRAVAWEGSWDLDGPQPASGDGMTVPGSAFEGLPDGEYVLTADLQGSTKRGTVIDVDTPALAFTVATPKPEISVTPTTDPTAISATPKHAAPESLTWVVRDSAGTDLFSGTGRDVDREALADLGEGTYSVEYTESFACKTATGTETFSVSAPPVIPPGKLVVEKSVSADASPVRTGAVLDYAIVLRNDGELPVDVALEDVMTDVVDDAALDVASVRSDAASVSVAVSAEDSLLAISGSLAGGETATVSYQVRVLAASDRGNSRAVNHVVAAGSERPAVGSSCDATTLSCTDTEIVADPSVPGKPDPDPSGPGKPSPSGPATSGTLAWTGAEGSMLTLGAIGLLVLGAGVFLGRGASARFRTRME